MATAQARSTRPKFANAVERTYASATSALLHQVVHNHSNGVVVVGVAPTHPMFAESRSVISVSFEAGKRDLTKNEVVGKRKRGGQFMQEDDKLCVITCSDGSTHMMRACIRGILIEVNEALVEQPELLNKLPTDEVYLAVIFPKESERLTGDRGTLKERLEQKLESIERERERREESRKRARESKDASDHVSHNAAAAPAAERPERDEHPRPAGIEPGEQSECQAAGSQEPAGL